MRKTAIAIAILAFSLAFIGTAQFSTAHAASEFYTSVNGVNVENRLLDAFAASPDTVRQYAVVGFSGPPTSNDIAALESTGLTVISYTHLPYAAVAGTENQVLSTTSISGVLSIHWNRPVQAFSHSVTPDPNRIARDTNAYGTGITTVGADRAWSLGVTGAGVGVAVIDTGIDTSNPSLALSPLGPVIQNVQVLSDELLLYPQHDVEVYVENQVNTDTYGHGTHVSGSVAGSGLASSGTYVGVAPGAHIIGLDGLQCAVIDLVLGGCLVTILSSFDYIVENQARFNIKVNTNSWGGGPEFNPDDPIIVSTNILVSKGITVLFAAGNAGPGADTMSGESRNPNVIAVAAGQPSGGLVEFSSRGVPGGDTPTIAAPGHLIISSRAHTGTEMQVFTAIGFDGILAPQHVPEYLVAQGTSMATPIAAGVAALILQANPDLTPAQVKAIMQKTATKMLGYKDFEVGAGFLNGEAAVRSTLGLSTRATRLKLPAHTELGFDQSLGTTTLSHHYRASITGFGAVGFRFHFRFSFPVYTNDSLPIELTVSWEHLQQYSVQVTGYRVWVADPNLNDVFIFSVPIAQLGTSRTTTLPADLRPSKTPAGGAYWYFDFISFSPGFGVIDLDFKVHYPESFKPPALSTEKIKPFKIHTKPDKSSSHPGAGLEAQGWVEDANGNGVDGERVDVELRGPLGNTVWQGSTTTVNGHFTSHVTVPAGVADGTYTIIASADGFTATAPLTIDSLPPVITGLSVTPTAGRSLEVAATWYDNSGVGYMRAMFKNTETGTTYSAILTQVDGAYRATLTLKDTDPVGTWQVEVSAVDKAGNGVYTGTSLGL